MPLYEYRCEACGAIEEKLESFSAPTEHTCPQCTRSAGMKRQISQAAFTLSGNGWYAKDYASGGKKGSSESSREAGAEASKEPPASAPTGCCGGACPLKHGT